MGMGTVRQVNFAGWAWKLRQNYQTEAVLSTQWREWELLTQFVLKMSTKELCFEEQYLPLNHPTLTLSASFLDFQGARKFERTTAAGSNVPWANRIRPWALVPTMSYLLFTQHCFQHAFFWQSLNSEESIIYILRVAMNSIQDHEVTTYFPKCWQWNKIFPTYLESSNRQDCQALNSDLSFLFFLFDVKSITFPGITFNKTNKWMNEWMNEFCIWWHQV